MSFLLYAIALAMLVIALAGNWFSGKVNRRAFLFDLVGGFSLGLAFIAERIAA